MIPEDHLTKLRKRPKSSLYNSTCSLGVASTSPSDATCGTSQTLAPCDGVILLRQTGAGCGWSLSRTSQCTKPFYATYSHVNLQHKLACDWLFFPRGWDSPHVEIIVLDQIQSGIHTVPHLFPLSFSYSMRFSLSWLKLGLSLHTKHDLFSLFCWFLVRVGKLKG